MRDLGFWTDEVDKSVTAEVTLHPKTFLFTLFTDQI